MTAYLALFATFVTLAATSWPRGWKSFAGITYVVLFAALTVFIGYRFLVGADWFNYEVMFLTISRMSLIDGLTVSDPAYSLVNWLVAQSGGSVWHVNLMCASLFSYALLRFVSQLPSPAAALISAVPTLVIVVAMGYSRQACAIACMMLAATNFNGSFSLRWVIWLSIGVAFHKSTIFIFPIFFFAANQNRTLSLIAGAGLGIALISTLILGNIQALIIIYVEAGQQSGGAIVRVALAVVTGLVFLVLPKASEWCGERRGLWRNMALASLALVPMFILVQSSTIVDRIAILLLPLQLVVFGSISRALTKGPLLQGAVLVAISSFQLSVLLVWLYYSFNVAAWIPYRNVLMEPYL